MSCHMTLFEELASHGYVVLCIGHPYWNPFVYGSNGEALPFDGQNEHYKAWWAESKNVIPPCPILIADGLHSMNEQLTSYLDFSIFICTSDDWLKQIRHQADITKRHQTIEFSKAHADSEFEKYKQFVEPYKKQANVILFLKEKWNYILYKGAKNTKIRCS